MCRIRPMAALRPLDMNCFPECDGTDRFSKPRLGNDLYSSSKQSFKVDLQPRKIQQRSARLKRDQKIDVAVIRLFPARY